MNASSSSSNHATSTDFPDSLSLSLSLTLSICLKYSSHPTSPLDYTLCQYKAVVGQFLLVGQHWHVHVKGSRGERHLHVRPCFPSNIPRVLFISFKSFCWWEVSGRTALFSCGNASRISCIPVHFLSSLFSKSFVNVHVVLPYSSMDTIAARKKFRFNKSNRSNFHMIGTQSIEVDETLLPRYMNLFANFRELPFRVEMSLSWLKHMNSVFRHSSGWQCFWLWMPISSVACSWLCSWYSACVGVFSRNAQSSPLSASVIVSASYVPQLTGPRRNTPRNMENKNIWWLTTFILLGGI